MAENVRALVVFRGLVQGVGFRYTTRRVAAGFAVTGYVRNLPGGGVELVAEGARDEISAFLRQIRSEMGSYIDDVEVSWRQATGEFGGFSIRH